MANKTLSKKRIIKIDANQPGASELIAILKAYDSTSVVPSKGKKNVVGIAIKNAKPVEKKAVYSNKVQEFCLGRKKEKSDKIVARQSCAVTVK